MTKTRMKHNEKKTEIQKTKIKKAKYKLWFIIEVWRDVSVTKDTTDRTAVYRDPPGNPTLGTV